MWLPYYQTSYTMLLLSIKLSLYRTLYFLILSRISVDTKKLTIYDNNNKVSGKKRKPNTTTKSNNEGGKCLKNFVYSVPLPIKQKYRWNNQPTSITSHIPSWQTHLHRRPWKRPVFFLPPFEHNFRRTMGIVWIAFNV